MLTTWWPIRLVEISRAGSMSTERRPMRVAGAEAVAARLPPTLRCRGSTAAVTSPRTTYSASRRRWRQRCSASGEALSQDYKGSRRDLLEPRPRRSPPRRSGASSHCRAVADTFFNVTSPPVPAEEVQSFAVTHQRGCSAIIDRNTRSARPHLLLDRAGEPGAAPLPAASLRDRRGGVSITPVHLNFTHVAVAERRARCSNEQRRMTRARPCAKSKSRG